MAEYRRGVSGEIGFATNKRIGIGRAAPIERRPGAPLTSAQARDSLDDSTEVTGRGPESR